MPRLVLASALAFLLSPAVAAQSDLIITGIVDADLPGGLPKAVELYVATDGTDLSRYALGTATNGGGSDGVELVLSGTADAGDFIYVSGDGTTTNDGATRFNEFFGFAPDFVDSDFDINGDDPVELFYDASGAFTGGESVTDVFGDIALDGSGEPWEYTDGWAYRGSGTGPDGSTFVLGHWAFSGPRALEDETSNASAATPFPIGSYVAEGAEIFDGPGWRLLAVPGGGVTVADLAGINLVQGVTGQYPSADDNLYPEYAGGGTPGYTAAVAQTDGVESGEGFFWYWFDSEFGPFDGGTSSSEELATFTLPVIGTERTTDVTAVRTRNNVDDLYMLGNPFQEPLDVAGITSNGTLSSSFLAYDPALGLGEEGATSGGYIELTAGDLLAVWQGVFAEVETYADAGDPSFSYAAASRVPAGNPVFYGRDAQPPTVALVMTGTLDGGTPVVDAVTKARFRDGATDGFDRFDFSELAPPNTRSAALAFAAERDGQPHRLAIHSMPAGLKGAVTLPVEFTTTGAGTFTVSADLVSVPEGWTATLRDLVSGAIVDLSAGESHTFTADAGAWTSRFELEIAAGSSVGAEDAPGGVELGRVSPNPASASATLSLRVDAPQRVTATVVDALGRTVQTAFSGDLAPSSDATIRLDASALAPGTYIVHVEGETFRQTRRLTVVR